VTLGNELGPDLVPSRLPLRLARALGVQESGRALRDFVTYLPTQGLPALAGLLVLPLLAHRLSPTTFGVLTLAQTAITLGWTVSGSWLTLAIVRELPAAREDGRFGSFARTLSRALLVSTGLLGTFCVFLLIVGVFSDAIAANLWLVVLAAAGVIAQNVASSLLAASLRAREYAVFTVISRTSAVTAGAALVLIGYHVTGYLAGYASAAVVLGTVGLCLSWPRNQAAGGERQTAAWIRYGFPASALGMASWMLAFVDRYILALLRSTGDVGRYSVGNLLGDKMISIPALAFMTAAAPLLVTAYERHGAHEVERLMRAYTRVLILVGLPTIAFLTASRTDLLHLVAGHQYGAGTAIVSPIVATGSLIYVLAPIAYSGLVISRKTRPMVHAAALGVLANIAANFALIPALGVIGAAIATPIGTSVFLAAAYRGGRPFAHWHFPWPTGARAAGSAFTAGALAAVVVHIVDGTATGLIAALIVTAAVYLAVLGALGELGDRQTAAM
jgi:O-antigen/teichoic acid export membrane protein